MKSSPSQADPPPVAAGPPSVHVVIVNYRTAGLTLDCLHSLAAERDQLAGRVSLTCVAVDNRSDDGSAEAIQAAIHEHGWGDWCLAMPLGVNGGFAAGNNAGIQPAVARVPPPDYVLLLNPDTVVRPSGVEALVAFMQEHREVGIAGSRLEYPDGEPQASAFRFHGILSELEHGARLGPVSRLLSRWTVAPPPRDQPHETGWVAGASMMVRRGVFDDIGGMDERYFLYYEEVDFCLRARRAGWGCWYVPQSRVVHLVGQASGVTDKKAPARRRPGYWFDSRRRYFTRNHGRLYAVAADAAWLLGFASWRLRRGLQRRPDTDPPGMLCDFARQSALVKT